MTNRATFYTLSFCKTRSGPDASLFNNLAGTLCISFPSEADEISFFSST